jgi:hypothetical protein
MWCPRCHTEVAAEIAPNGQSLNCTACGTEIQRVYAPSLHPDTRSARELLERWSKNDLLDVHEGAAPVAGTPAFAEEQPAPSEIAPSIAASSTAPPVEASSDAASRRDRPERGKPERPTPKPRTTWRVDAPHNLTQPTAPPPPPVPPRRPHFSAVAGDDEAPEANLAAEQIASEPVAAVIPMQTVTPKVPVAAAESVAPHRQEAQAPEPVAQATRVVHRRLDPPHEASGRPHFDLQTFLSQDARKPGRSESIWGQVLAYLGVGLITVGTTLVLWGWFGKSPQYAPTGWLICTIGQMLLFLGVTTLISGGLQQSSHEVTRRVEYLGDRIIRFEHSTEELLRGPHFLEREGAGRRETSRTESAES